MFSNGWKPAHYKTDMEIKTINTFGFSNLLKKYINLFKNIDTDILPANKNYYINPSHTGKQCVDGCASAFFKCWTAHNKKTNHIGKHS